MSTRQPKNNLQLTNELRTLNTKYEALFTEVSSLKKMVDSKPALSDIARSEKALTSKITDNADEIVRIERKLSSINLPEETRYYLTENEITNFQSNLSRLLAMMASFKQLYENLVSYTTANS